MRGSINFVSYYVKFYLRNDDRAETYSSACLLGGEHESTHLQKAPRDYVSVNATLAHSVFHKLVFLLSWAGSSLFMKIHTMKEDEIDFSPNFFILFNLLA